VEGLGGVLYVFLYHQFGFSVHSVVLILLAAALLIAVISRGGMGGGDIKLVAMIGAFLGWPAVLMTIFLGAFTGAVAGLALMLLGKKGRKDMVPFGPFLALGALLAMVWGQDMLRWYLRI
jgi:leader peptidase (prepilin peptidase)/N-methyltransferase